MVSNRQKIILVLLFSVLGLGAAAKGAALTPFCGAKTCCNGQIHIKATMSVAETSPDIRSDQCDLMLSSACCRLNPIQPRADVALWWMAAPHAYRMATHSLASENRLPKPLPVTAGYFRLADQYPKIPPEPIYLINLAILC